MEIKIKKKKPMPMGQKIFYMISAIVIIGAFIYLGTKDFQAPKNKKSDNIAFAEEYGITTNNIFKYKSAKEIVEILKNGNGVIFFAFPENKWSKIYAIMLNETAIRSNIKEIYYYNFKSARSSNSHNYNQMTNILNDYLTTLDTDIKNIYAPSMVIIKNGTILFYDNETSIMTGTITPNEYWTTDKMKEKETIMQTMFETYLTIE